MSKQDFANGVTPPMEIKKRKKCELCDSEYIPTHHMQKYCPECRALIKAGKKPTEKDLAYLKARQPGPVTTYKVEVPEKKMQLPETPEDPIVPDGIRHGYTDLLRAIDKPDWEAFLDQAHAVLIAYGRGDLVDKSELMAELREKFKSFLEV